MFTTSEIAPMMQKLLLFATAPKMNASTKPPSTTVTAGVKASAMAQAFLR
jgi:hypothetical protein